MYDQEDGFNWSWADSNRDPRQGDFPKPLWGLL